ncbi:MAG: DedA family protein [Candidatus Vogelbacteria bacterium]|nr:DedA family protein [Candidatus Vogelbacteria bacterium]
MAIFSLTLDQIIALLHIYGYFLLFPIAFLEGPIITVIAGFLSAHGVFVWYWAYLVVIAGDLGGDIFYYFIGRFSRHGFLLRWGKYLGIEEREVEKIEEHFRRHPGKTIIIAKWTQVAGLPVLIAAGIAKMPLGPFTFYNALGTVVKSAVLLSLGYFAGAAYQQIDSYFSLASTVSFFIAVLLLVGYIIYRRRRKKSLPK